MASQPLRGYRRLPGSQHRYLTPSGANISEYEYRSRKARAAGYRNYTQQRHFRESREFRGWRFKARSENPDAETGAGSQIERDARDVQALRDAGDDRVNDPDGPLARLLVASGRRDPHWSWAVGETPAGIRAGR